MEIVFNSKMTVNRRIVHYYVLVLGDTPPETFLGFGSVGIGLKMVYRTSWLDKATNFTGKATTLYPFWSQNCSVLHKRYRKVDYHHPNKYLNPKFPNKLNV